ncbi:MAG: DUF5946 family protein [Terriglobales bacterium]
MDRQKPCFSCGALAPDIDGPIHPYMTSSPGCWSLYGQVLANQYAPDHRDPGLHQTIVDAYACQHPGKPERRAIQSVNSHLVGLYLVYEKGLAATHATAALKRIVEDACRVAGFQRLEPPSFAGMLTIADVAAAASASERQRLVRAWGEAVWNAWRVRHLQTVAAHATKLLP